MKLSAWVTVHELVTMKKTVTEQFIAAVLKGQKSIMFATEPLSHIFPALKNAGVDGLELLVPLHTTDANLTTVEEIVKQYHIPVQSIHQSLDSFRNVSATEIERLCDIANRFNVSVITLHANALGKRLFDPEFIRYLKHLQKKHAVTFGIENMPKSPFSLFSPYSWEGKTFSETVTSADFSMTFDTTHLGQVGEDICAFYRENQERIVNIHLSNYTKHWLNTKLFLVSRTHLPLSEGELPIGKFLKLLKDTNYAGLVTMEINADLAGLCESARIVRDGTKS